LHLDKPSTAAAHEILAEVRRDSARAGPHADPSIVQLLFWMKESSEIVLLDFLLDQRERDDNLELEAAWVWIDGDRLRWRAARTAETPADLAAQRPLSLRRSWLRDNHALGLARGGDVTPPGDTLAQLRHLHLDTFRRLLAFDRELRSGGPLRDWLAEGFGLSDAQVAGIARRAQTAAGHLAAACRAGGLRFDLDPEGFLVEKKVEPRAMNCPDP
jgi:hypothetical protein